MRKAIIDLGTNTFNLLIADVHGSNFTIVHAEKNGVSLGMGGINENKITEQSMQRGLLAIQKFLDVCHDFSVQAKFAFGTSALRDAENQTEFLIFIEKATSLKIEVISGEREALLIYEGVKQVHNFKESGVIIDIGGGSTEFIFADDTGVREMKSLNIGVSRIHQKYNFSDPLTPDDIDQIEGFLDFECADYFQARKEKLIVGSSGSFETFWEIANQAEFPIKKETSKLSCSELDVILENLIFSTFAEREKNTFIIPIRRIMMPVTAVKTRWLIRQLQAENIIISPFSLKEGALLNVKE